MTEIKPATDEDIVRIEQDIDIGWTINPRSVRSLIARIRAERENTIRECAERISRHHSRNTIYDKSRKDAAYDILALSQEERT